MTRRTWTALVPAALAAIAAFALAAGGASGAASTTIKVDDNFFSPAKKSVAKGTTVRFNWVGDNPHNVVKRKGPGGSFASETTSKPGVNFTKKFKKAGTYKIVCTIHDGMNLRLKVG
jgi:plastocyanin